MPNGPRHPPQLTDWSAAEAWPLTVRYIRTEGESGCSVTLRVGVPEGHAEAGCGRVGADNAAGRVEGAVEQGRLDPHVVMEPFQVPQVRHGRRSVGMQVRG